MPKAGARKQLRETQLNDHGGHRSRARSDRRQLAGDKRQRIAFRAQSARDRPTRVHETRRHTKRALLAPLPAGISGTAIPGEPV